MLSCSKIVQINLLLFNMVWLARERVLISPGYQYDMITTQFSACPGLHSQSYDHNIKPGPSPKMDHFV